MQVQKDFMETCGQRGTNCKLSYSSLEHGSSHGAYESVFHVILMSKFIPSMCTKLVFTSLCMSYRVLTCFSFESIDVSETTPKTNPCTLSSSPKPFKPASYVLIRPSHDGGAWPKGLSFGDLKVKGSGLGST